MNKHRLNQSTKELIFWGLNAVVWLILLAAPIGYFKSGNYISLVVYGVIAVAIAYSVFVGSRHFKDNF